MEKNIINKGYLLAAGVAFTAAVPALAQSDEQTNIDALFDMPLEQLTQIVVTTPSKTPIKIERSPGVVRVYTRRDIEAANFKTLQELLQQAPGIQIAYSKRGHQQIWMRGIQGSENSKLLLMVDGIPRRSFDDGNFLIDESFSLRNVERIEILNGPGSVLYGAGSFAGIINVTTRDQGNEATISYQTQRSYQDGKVGDYREGYGSSVTLSNDQWHLYAEGFNNEGFEPELNFDGEVSTHNQKRELNKLSLKYRKGNFEWVSDISEYRFPYSYHTQNTQFIQMEKSTHVGAKYTYLGIKISANYSNVKTPSERTVRNTTTGALTRLVKRSKTSEAYNIDAQYPFTYGEDHDLMIGLQFHADSANNATLTKLFVSAPNEDGAKYRDEPLRRDVGIFLQDIYQINDEVSLTSGIRFSDIKDFDSQTSFRMGLNWVKEEYFTKLLYGTAYRIPDYEDYLDIKTDKSSPAIPLIDDAYPDVEPEQLSTTELQLGKFLSDQSQIDLTLYHNEYTDYLSSAELNSVNGIDTFGRPFGINFDERTITGMELHYRTELFSNLKLDLNYSHIFSATEDLGEAGSNLVLKEPFQEGKHDLLMLSKHIFNSSIIYRANNKLSYALHIAFNSERKVNNLYQTDSDYIDNDNKDNFYKIDVNGQYKITPTSDIKVTISNLTDEKIYNPILGDITEYDAQWPRRALGIEYGWQW